MNLPGNVATTATYISYGHPTFAVNMDAALVGYVTDYGDGDYVYEAVNVPRGPLRPRPATGPAASAEDAVYEILERHGYSACDDEFADGSGY